MEEIGKVIAAAMIGACCCLVIRGQSGVLGMLVSLAASVAILAFAVRFLSPFLDLVQSIRDLTGMTDSLTAPVVKVAGIGILTQLAGSVCEDSGEKALGKAVNLGGTILSVYTALPVLHAVIQLMEQILGNHG